MKRFSILTESPSGIRRDSGLILRAESKSIALAWAKARGVVGKVIALEIVDAQEAIHAE